MELLVTSFDTVLTLPQGGLPDIPPPPYSAASEAAAPSNPAEGERTLRPPPLLARREGASLPNLSRRQLAPSSSPRCLPPPSTSSPIRHPAPPALTCGSLLPSPPQPGPGLAPHSLPPGVPAPSRPYAASPCPLPGPAERRPLPLPPRPRRNRRATDPLNHYTSSCSARTALPERTTTHTPRATAPPGSEPLPPPPPPLGSGSRLPPQRCPGSAAGSSPAWTP